jgi:hypothetical protein
VHQGQVMSAGRCAEIIVEAAGRRRREVLTSGRSKMGLWLKLIAPGLVDNIALRAIEHGR